MNITSKLKIDLQNNSGSAWIQSMQEDTNTRCVEIQLYSGSQPWEIPAGTTAAVGFKKPDGTVGLYDKLPDGTDAITLFENIVSVVLVPQMLTVPGLVRAVVTLYDANRNQLSTFPFHIQVEENPAVGKIVSENYCYYTSVAEINEALNAALNRMEETVSTVETKMENGEFNGKSAYEYAKDGGYTDTEEAFSQALANGMVDEAALEKIVADYLEKNPPVSGGTGENGATFTPALDASGNLSWSNDKGLANPTSVNIKGPKGDAGAQGPQGEKGDTGATGPQGPQGEKGDTGAAGPQGPQGEKGDTGATGPQGLQGPQGPQGEKGDTGATGPQGPQGEKGESGTGVTILGSYETAEALRAAHPKGSVGESYLVAGHLYVWSESDSDWVDVGNIQGPQGEKGERGDTGAQGIQGIPGEKGEKGDIGLQGPQGEKGDPGEPGVEGAKGDKGDPGSAGKDGVSATHSWNGTTLTITSASGTSSANLKGDKGDTGADGVKGDKGDKGEKGDTGEEGKTPVKGTDYYTEADKAEMVNMVLNALPTWTGGSY